MHDSEMPDGSKLPIFGQLSRKSEVLESKGLNKVVSFSIFNFQIKKN